MNSLAAPPAIPSTEECWAEVAGHKMRYLRAGSGPPLLLIHGLLGYSFSWRFNIPVLSDFRTVFAPDLLGTGFSDRPGNLACNLKGCAERMLEFMDRVGIASTDLVGTSHGGGVATLMADMAPDRVRKLVLVAPVNPWSKNGRMLTRVLATHFGRLGMKAAAPAVEALSQVWLARLYGSIRRISPGTLEGYRAPLAKDGTWDYGLDIVECWHNDLRQLETSYGRISNPTLLLWGDRDAAVYVSSAEEILKRIAGSHLHVFPGAGHLAYEEFPDEFNRVLREFLESLT